MKRGAQGKTLPLPLGPSRGSSGAKEPIGDGAVHSCGRTVCPTSTASDGVLGTPPSPQKHRGNGEGS